MLNNSKFYLICSLIGFWLFPFDLAGQEFNQKYDFVKIKESVSLAGVSKIIQDQNDFIWMATNGSGLYRFDGVNYTYYNYDLNNSSSISSNFVKSIFLDHQNRLWVGTDKGLNLYDRDKDEFIRISAPGFSKYNLSILSIGGDGKDYLFFSTILNGLFRINLKTVNTENILVTQYESHDVHTMLSTKNGKLYAGTKEGLKEFDAKTVTIKQSHFNYKKKSSQISSPVQSLLIDKNDNLWVGTVSDGIYKINNIKKESSIVNHYPISKNKIFSLIELADGSIMCGTENDGLIHIDSDANIIANYSHNRNDKKSLQSNSIWSLFLDKNDRIWMGYYNKGVAVYDKLYDKFNELESLDNNINSLQGPSVMSITEDKLGNFWVAMDGGGIDIFNPDSNTFTHINKEDNEVYSGLTDNHILTVFIDSQENVWAGSWNKGLFVLEKGTTKFINYTKENTNGNLASNTILSITEDAFGTIWMGTFYSGLNSYNPRKKEFNNHKTKPFLNDYITNSNIRKVLIDYKNDLYLATDVGLYKVSNLGKNELSLKPLRSEMEENYKYYTPQVHIISLFESKDNSLWIGTLGAGLCKFDTKKNTFIWYNKTKNLNQENVYGITESNDGNIWVSGNYGLSKLNLDTDMIINFAADDGLLSNDFNYNAVYKDAQGNLYFGNYQGIDFFNPNNIIKNTHLPSLTLTDFKLFNKSVLPQEEESPLKKVISETHNITLSHNQSVFSIEYSGINYTRPERIEYAYYLDGYESSWNYVGNKRSATYTNLDSGNYTFMLKAANNDGVWNDTPLSLKITIRPPWYMTNYAILGYILLTLLGIYRVYCLGKERTKKKQLIENEKNKRIQEIELNKKRIQFFTNISHEFRTPLTLIMNPIEDIIQDKTIDLPYKIKEKHNVIHKNTNRLYRLINELLDFRKLELNSILIKAEQLNLVDFIKEITTYFKEEALVENINFGLNYDKYEEVFVWVDKNMLEKIIFNILSNAFKMTPEGGIVNIGISSKEDSVIMPLVNEKNPVRIVDITISDTGPGLEENELKRIFDRFYQVDRLNKSYYGSTGIGLEVVKNFVELHKGNVLVSSKPSEGTIFTIRLPLGKEHLNENEIKYTQANDDISQVEHLTADNRSNEIGNLIETKSEKLIYKLLIVEDNTELRNYLKGELNNHYKILTAKNGKEGLKKTKEFLPDIIITDVIMPEMDGYDFCEKIKSDISTSHIPVLMLTAKTRIESKIKGIEIGADAYLEKPFNMQLLKLSLSQLIDSRQVIFNKFLNLDGESKNTNLTMSLDKQFIQKILQYINENMSDPDLNVELLASHLNLSRSQFYRKVKALTNQTANEFLRNVRLQKAKQIIETGNSNITEVSQQVGFSSPSYFTKCFKKKFGLLPKEIKIKD